MSIRNAINCFEENIRLFGDAGVQPEKYNLYAGLAAVAHALEHLETEICAVKKEVGRIERESRCKS
jgi:hypothetical protein